MRSYIWDIEGQKGPGRSRSQPWLFLGFWCQSSAGLLWGHSGEGEIPLFQPCFLLVSGILEIQILINLFPGWGGKGLVARQESLSVQAEGARAPNLEGSLPHYFLIRMSGASR